MKRLAGNMAADIQARRGRRLPHWLPFAVIALVGALGAVAVYRNAADADAARIRGAMELRADWRARDFESKLRILANPVEAMAVLFASGNTVSDDLFNRFAAGSHTDGNPLRRLAWAPRMVRQADGGDFFPVELEHSFAGTRMLAGTDLAADPQRRAVIERARDLAQPRSTGVVPLPDSPATGYIVFWPIYRSGAATGTVEERRAALRGFVVGTFAIDAALNAAIEDTPPIVETIFFFAGREPLPGALDATYSPDRGVVTPGGRLPATPGDHAIRMIRSFDDFGQKWTLVSDFSPAAFASLHSSAVWAFPAGVLLLTAMLMTYLVGEQGRSRQLEERVAARTTELRAANEALAVEIEARQTTSLQLAQAQKMEAIGNLTGGMAHDFNNLLGIIIGNLDLLRDRQSDGPDAGELTSEALDAALRGADLTRRLLAHMTGGKDAKRVEKAAATLTPEQWQYWRRGQRQDGDKRMRIFERNSGGDLTTRIVRDACIFLNRPEFPGGAGCALHRAALERGKAPLTLKPDVCWQLPLRREDEVAEDGHVTSVIRQWDRRDWGEGGQEFAWWCTESPDAFVGEHPVYREMRDELVELVGEPIYRRLTRYLEARAMVMSHAESAQSQSAADGSEANGNDLGLSETRGTALPESTPAATRLPHPALRRR